MIEPSVRTHCIRCGECCRHSTPSFHTRDLKLIEDGHISKSMIYTLRVGEIVWDNINGGKVVLQEELIKVRESPEGSCTLFNNKESSCRIYEWRPAQCKALKCWDTEEYFEVYKERKLKRTDIVKDGALLGLIEEHDRRCSYRKIERIIENIPSEGEEAVTLLLEILKFDYHIRPFVSEQMGLSEDEMNFYFGRPLIDTISMFGLRVIKKKNQFILTTKA